MKQGFGLVTRKPIPYDNIGYCSCLSGKSRFVGQKIPVLPNAERGFPMVSGQRTKPTFFMTFASVRAAMRSAASAPFWAQVIR